MTKTRLSILCLTAILIAGASPTAPNPWFGTWKLRLKTPEEKPETLVYSDAGGGAMRMVSVEDNSIIVTRFDGKPASDGGSAAGTGNSLAIKAISSSSYTWTFFLGGKPHVEGINTLSADRKTFKEVSWSVGKPDTKINLVYERQ